MKMFLKIIAFSLPLMAVSPTFAGIRFGIDIRFGRPPVPREIICAPPYEGAVWAPGYYHHFGYRYIWVPGRWNRPLRFREGWERERFEHRGWDRDYHDRGRGRDEFQHREGRIR